LLCEQNVLRDFKKEYRSVFSATREKRHWLGSEFDMRCNVEHDYAIQRFVRSTISPSARTIVRDSITAARGPLYVSHLILGR